MIDPPSWTSERLAADRLRAIEVFRAERSREPLEYYLKAFDLYRSHFERFLDTTADLVQLESRALEVLTDRDLLEAFRYLAAPPISEDDLQVLSDAPTLGRGHLRANPESVKRLVDTVSLILDRRRFAWVAEGRGPTETEREAAVVASSALLAASWVQTKRRTAGKIQQENRVRQALLNIGFKEVARRPIPNVTLAPGAGEFCGESLLGLPKSDPRADKGRLADIVVRLRDHRLMPIECKVSNSSLNSLKRLNNDAAVKAATWKRDFGVHQVVPAAVLSGVFDLHNLLDAQGRKPAGEGDQAIGENRASGTPGGSQAAERKICPTGFRAYSRARDWRVSADRGPCRQARGLTIFWEHDLKPLTDFVTAED